MQFSRPFLFVAMLCMAGPALAQIDLVSPARTPLSGNTSVNSQCVSADGRYVVLLSNSPEIVPGANNNITNVYRWDTWTDQVLLISRSNSTGLPAALPCSFISISHDGSKIAFNSQDTSMAAGAGGLRSVYYAQISGSTVTLRAVSPSSGTTTVWECKISGDGNYIYFADDTTSPVNSRIRRYNTTSFGITTIVDASSQLPGVTLSEPVSSTNGNVVAFRGNFSKVYTTTSPFGTVVDQSLVTGGGNANSSQQTPFVGGNGTYMLYASTATNIVSGANGLTQIIGKTPNSSTSAFWESINSGSAIALSACAGPELSINTIFSGFRTSASNFPGANGKVQVYRRDASANTLTLATLLSNESTSLLQNVSSHSMSALGGHFAYVAPLSAHYVDFPTNPILWFRDIAGKKSYQLRTSQVQLADHDAYRAAISRNGKSIAVQSSSNYVSNRVRYSPSLALYPVPVYAWDESNPTTMTMVQEPLQTDVFVSIHNSLSDDGRFVAIITSNTPAFATDTNSSRDIMRVDRLTGVSSVANITSAGTLANAHSSNGSISGDGNRMVFQTFANNLGAVPTFGGQLIWMKDFTTGQLKHLSVNAPGNSSAEYPYISALGNYAVYSVSNSAGAGLPESEYWQAVGCSVDGTVTTELLSKRNGVPANGDSFAEDVSEDGRYVAIFSRASNLIPGVSGSHIYRLDRLTGEFEVATTSSLGVPGNGTPSYANISADGQFIVFQSNATNLFPGVTSGQETIYRKDMATGRILVVSKTEAGSPVPGFSCDVSDRGEYVVWASEWTVKPAFPSNLQYQSYRTKVQPASFMVRGVAKLDRVVVPQPEKLTIQLLGAGDAVIETYRVTCTALGDYQFVIPNDATIKLRIKGRKWLSTVTPSTSQTDGTYWMPTVLLTNGDCNNDNVVTTDDYLILSDAFDTTVGDPGYDARGDLDGDGFITTDDYLILSDSFDLSGE